MRYNRRSQLWVVPCPHSVSHIFSITVMKREWKVHSLNSSFLLPLSHARHQYALEMVDTLIILFVFLKWVFLCGGSFSGVPWFDFLYCVFYLDHIWYVFVYRMAASSLRLQMYLSLWGRLIFCYWVVIHLPLFSSRNTVPFELACMTFFSYNVKCAVASNERKIEEINVILVNSI